VRDAQFAAFATFAELELVGLRGHQRGFVERLVRGRCVWS
jgi:hypothetical protein